MKKVVISQIELVSTIMMAVAEQVPGITANQAQLAAVIRAADSVKAAFDTPDAEEAKDSEA